LKSSAQLGQKIKKPKIKKFKAEEEEEEEE